LGEETRLLIVIMEWIRSLLRWRLVMRAFHIRCGPRRHLAWLLSVALLLPIAQTAATWHVLSVACVDRGDVHGKPLSHPLRCDFCLTVAGLGSGAATGAPVDVPQRARFELQAGPLQDLAVQPEPVVDDDCEWGAGPVGASGGAARVAGIRFKPHRVCVARMGLP